MRRLRQAGDTIVEVLIATAVLGVVLAGAYGVASRSLRAARQAQERGEALKLVESQIELLKNYQLDPQAVGGESIFNADRLFCMNSNITDTSDPRYQRRVNFPVAAPTALESAASDNLGLYPVQCRSGRYRVAIQATDLGASRYQFRIVVRWDSTGNAVRDEVSMQYRLSP